MGRWGQGEAACGLLAPAAPAPLAAAWLRWVRGVALASLPACLPAWTHCRSLPAQPCLQFPPPLPLPRRVRVLLPPPPSAPPCLAGRTCLVTGLSRRLRYLSRGSVDSTSRSWPNKGSPRWRVCWCREAQRAHGRGPPRGQPQPWHGWACTTCHSQQASPPSTAARLPPRPPHRQVGHPVVCEDEPLQLGYRLCGQRAAGRGRGTGEATLAAHAGRRARQRMHAAACPLAASTPPVQRRGGSSSACCRCSCRAAWRLPHELHSCWHAPSRLRAMRLILLLLRCRHCSRGSLGKPSSRTMELSDRSMLSNWFCGERGRRAGEPRVRRRAAVMARRGGARPPPGAAPAPLWRPGSRWPRSCWPAGRFHTGCRGSYTGATAGRARG